MEQSPQESKLNLSDMEQSPQDHQESKLNLSDMEQSLQDPCPAGIAPGDALAMPEPVFLTRFFETNYGFC